MRLHDGSLQVRRAFLTADWLTAWTVSVMLMLGESSIREVIAFPKNQNAQCLMSGAPGDISAERLRELSGFR